MRIKLEPQKGTFFLHEVASLRAENKRLREEINRRKGDPVTRLHNICESMEEDLPCGHPLAAWCDRCATCGGCEDDKARVTIEEG